jgi:hypothetical protein
VLAEHSYIQLAFGHSQVAKACNVKTHLDGSVHLVYRFEKEIQTFWLPPDSEPDGIRVSAEAKLPHQDDHSWSNSVVGETVVGETVLCAIRHSSLTNMID